MLKIQENKTHSYCYSDILYGFVFILNSNKFNEQSPVQYSSKQVEQVQRPVFSEPKITESINIVDESIPSLVGKWRCVSGEDVIDTYESNGIYRRLWVKQQTEFVYKWK